jgi:hypothetical protein
MLVVVAVVAVVAVVVAMIVAANKKKKKKIVAELIAQQSPAPRPCIGCAASSRQPGVPRQAPAPAAPAPSPSPSPSPSPKLVPVPYSAPGAAAAIVACPKRGMGGGTADHLRALGVSWYYRWGPTAPEVEGVEFVPMKFGVKWPSLDAISVVPRHVLMYNEPNHPEQARMGPGGTPGILTPEAAAADWPAFEAYLAKNPGVRLGSPCPAPDGHKSNPYADAFKWMDDYIAALPPGAWDRVQFTTMHFYGNNVRDLKKNVDRMWTKYGKPVWITEFAGVGTPAQNQALMREALPWLDADPRVERYAWYTHGGDANSSWLKGGNALFDKDKQLTALGRMYACTN